MHVLNGDVNVMLPANSGPGVWLGGVYHALNLEGHHHITCCTCYIGPFGVTFPASPACPSGGVKSGRNGSSVASILSTTSFSRAASIPSESIFSAMVLPEGAGLGGVDVRANGWVRRRVDGRG